MRAIIMAGGEGKRLRPMTCTVPKPMVPIAGRPCMEHCVELLRKHGITDITATLFYLPDSIKNYFKDDIYYCVEDRPLGTAGSVKNAVMSGGGSDGCLVISGDAVTDADITALLRSHRQSGAAATIAVYRVDAPMEYGIVLTDREGFVTRFLEKPPASELVSDMANTGIYVLSPEAIAMIPDGKYDFSKELFPDMLSRGMKLNTFRIDGYWCDVGSLEAYVRANGDVLSGKCNTGFAAGGAVVEQGAMVSQTAMLTAPCLVCAGAEVGDGSEVGPYSVIGAGAKIGAYASISRSVVHGHARIREGCELRGAVVCKGAHLAKRCRLFEGTCVGEEADIGAGCEVKQHVLIWPQKRVDSDSRLSENVIWDADAPSPMERSSISGHADRDVTVKAAAVYGAALAAASMGIAGHACVATDGRPASVMTAYAFMAGAMSQGMDACYLECTSRFALGHMIRTMHAACGAYVSTGGDDPHSADIAIMDAAGAGVSGAFLRRLEQLMAAGDLPPVTSRELGVMKRITGAEHMTAAFIASACKIKPFTMRTRVLIGGEAVASAAMRALYGMNCDVMLLRDGAEPASAMREKGAVLCAVADDEFALKAVCFGDVVWDTERLTAALLYARAEEMNEGSLAVPVWLPEEYASAISEAGASITRCPGERDGFMRAASESGTLFPELFSSAAAVVRLLALIRESRLETIEAALPKPKTASRSELCSWRDMARIMRSVAESADDGIELVDGVTLRRDDGWVLVRPDRTFTACRITAGSLDEEYSKELCGIYADKVRKAIKTDTEG